MLRGDASFELAVVMGDGALAQLLRDRLDQSSFCAAVKGRESVARADLVIVAAGPNETLGVLIEVMAAVAPSALITDLCPVKSRLLANMEDTVAPGYGYVSSSLFPAAGDPLLGATVAVIPLMGSVPEAMELLRKLWEQLGAGHVVQLDGQTHDLWVAARQISAELDRVVAAAAGRDSLPGTAPAALTDEARALNGEFIAWLVDNLNAGP